MTQICAICHASLLKPAAEIQTKDPFRMSRERFRLIQCASCFTWILNPRPSMQRMADYYQSDFLFSRARVPNSLLGALAVAIQRLNLSSEVRWIFRHLKSGGVFLDYSAGNGQVIQELRRHRNDLRCFATEFSHPFRQTLATVISADFVRAEIDEFPQDLKFDLIALFGVLEHVQDPKELLRRLGDRLNHGGKILLSVPNPRSLQKWLAGFRWYSWLVPRHFHLMPMPTLKRLVEELGFSAVEEKHFFLRTCSATFVLSLFPSLDPLLKPSRTRLLAYGICFYLLLPIEFLLSLVGWSGFMGLAVASDRPKC